LAALQPARLRLADVVRAVPEVVAEARVAPAAIKPKARRRRLAAVVVAERRLLLVSRIKPGCPGTCLSSR